MYSTMFLLFSSNTIYIMLTCVILTIVLIANDINVQQLKQKLSWKIKSKLSQLNFLNDNSYNKNIEIVFEKEAPGPKRKLIIGNLDVFSGYDVPYKAFSELAEKYGNIIKLQMGSVPSLVVNGVENIKEVLIYKGHDFDARPNFKRFQMLFDGNKENSLAFCDWSVVQKTRRELLSTHTFPRTLSMNFNRLNDITIENYHQLSSKIHKSIDYKNGVSIQPLIMAACGNIFTEYFTTRSFDYCDEEFQRMIKNFDKIFWEVNHGSAADFLPFLYPFQYKKMKEFKNMSNEIRKFILNQIIGDRYTAWNTGNEPNDFIESLIDHVKQKLEPHIDWETALFALEDIVGGHSAVANFLHKTLTMIAKDTEVQRNIQSEVDNLLNERSEKSVMIGDRNKLIYTQATIMEALRVITSPIVPHVASKDSSIDGYTVKAGTLIFINNYDLNMSESLWESPEKFEPKRFISNGRILKPDHFMPFGMGTRSCMGYKIVQFLSLTILANLMKEFDISHVNGEEIKVQIGLLAMPENSHRLVFTPRY